VLDLLEQADGTITADHIGCKSVAKHLSQELTGFRSAEVLLTRGDASTITYQVSHQGRLKHLSKQFKGCLPLLLFPACADNGIAGNNIWGDRVVKHLQQQMQKSFPAVCFLVRRSRCILTRHLRHGYVWEHL